MIGMIRIFIVHLLVIGMIPCIAYGAVADEQSSAKGTIKGTLDDGTKIEARIVGLVGLDLIQPNNPMKNVPVVVVKGNYTVMHPLMADTLLLDPTKYKDANSSKPRVVEARGLSTDKRVIVIKGDMLFAPIHDENGKIASLDTSPMFLPGAIWDVKTPIQFGYTDKAKTKIRILKPGKYIIEAYGIPISYKGGETSSNKTSYRTVQRIQEYLKILGYDIGALDGLMDERTGKAIRAFQDLNNMEVNGQASEELQRRLTDAVKDKMGY